MDTLDIMRLLESYDRVKVEIDEYNERFAAFFGRVHKGEGDEDDTRSE